MVEFKSSLMLKDYTVLILIFVSENAKNLDFYHLI